MKFNCPFCNEPFDDQGRSFKKVKCPNCGKLFNPQPIKQKISNDDLTTQGIKEHFVHIKFGSNPYDNEVICALCREKIQREAILIEIMDGPYGTTNRLCLCDKCKSHFVATEINLCENNFDTIAYDA